MNKGAMLIHGDLLFKNSWRFYPLSTKADGKNDWPLKSEG
ncbi:hypothetical protein L580_2357 [Serratia fonticola AU-P3(3)]|nr:hypothetical protein L580_2357 [Serratia fonticola AU-P3(3)]